MASIEKNDYPKFTVRAKKYGPVAKSYYYYQDWMGPFYRSNIDAVESHMAIHFPVSKNRDFTFGIFLKNAEGGNWKFVKCLNAEKKQ